MTKSWGSLSRLLSAVLLLALVVLSFQNCKVDSFIQTSLNEASNTISGGNGSGYDGKLFVHLSTEVCADGEGYDKAITLHKDKYYLVRNDCVNLPAESQIEVQVEVIGQSATQILYQNQIYIERLNLISDIQIVDNSYIAYGMNFEVVNQKLQVGDRYLGRFDLSGKKIWSTNIKRAEISDFQRIAPMPDGGLVHAERFSKLGDSSSTSTLVRYGKNGEVLWSRQLGVVSGKLWYQTLQTDQNGFIYLSGVHHNGASSIRGVLTRVDPNGNITYSKVFPSDNTGSTTVHIAPNGQLYLVGVIARTAFMMSLDENGLVNWSKRYTGLSNIRLSFGDSGEIYASVRVNQTVPGTTIIISFERYALLNSAGQIQRYMKLSNQQLSTFSNIHIYPSGDGGLYMTIPADKKPTTFLRLNSDLTLDWARELPLQDGTRFWKLFARAEGQYYGTFSKDSSLRPYSTNLLIPIDVEKMPQTCELCTKPVLEVVAADEDIQETTGPILDLAVDLSIQDYHMPETAETDSVLPF